MLAVMLVATSMAMPVMAEDAEPVVLIDSNMSDSSAYSTELSTDVYVANWYGLGSSVGDSSRNSFVTNSGTSFSLVFDAGNGAFTSVEFKTAITNEQFKYWFDDIAEKDAKRVYYSNDAETWTPVDVTLTMEQDTYPRIGTMVAENIPNARYVKISCGFHQGHGAFFHSLKLMGYEKYAQTLLDSDLTSLESVSSATGYDIVNCIGNWPYSQMGYDSGRYFIANASAGEFSLTFDVGANKIATEAQFLVSAGGSEWHINQDGSMKILLKVSNDGINWKDISVVPATESIANTYLTKVLTWSIPDGYRYVKIRFNSHVAARHIYVHHVTLKGFNEAPEYSYTDDLVTNTTATFSNIQRVDWTSGSQDTPYWVLKDAGIDPSVRPSAMATVAWTKGYITFDSGEDTLFSGADMRVTARDGNDRWLVQQEVHYKNYWEYSTDGVTWINPQITTGTSLSASTYIHSIKLPAPARYVRYCVYANYRDKSGVFHSANLYTTGPNLQFKENPAITKSGTTITATGNVINQGGAKANVNVILAVYEGDKLVGAGLNNFASLATGDNAYTATADISGAASNNLTTKVFVWNSEDLTPVFEYVPTK